MKTAIVKTPLQLVCSIEYIKKYNLDINTINFVYIDKYQLSKTQMINTFDFYEIKKFATIKYANSNVWNLGKKNFVITKKNPLKIILKIISFASNYFADKKLFNVVNNSKTIIIGDPNLTIIKKIIDKVNSKNIVFLDDGLGSAVYKFKFNQVQNNLTAFTFLPINDKQINNIINNNFKYIREKELITDINYNLFIGQPLIEAGVLKKKEFEEYLNEISFQNKNSTVIYLAHRWEKLIDEIKFPENFKIVNELILPIELYIIKNKISPQKIYSFYSSALITLQLILHENTIFSSIDIRNKIKNDNIEYAYRTIEYMGIKLINLN